MGPCRSPMADSAIVMVLPAVSSSTFNPDSTATLFERARSEKADLSIRLCGKSLRQVSGTWQESSSRFDEPAEYGFVLL